MLNNIGLPGLLLIAVVVLVLFGRGKISSLMGEVGKGITAFKRGVSDGTKEIEDAETVDSPATRPATPVETHRTATAADAGVPADHAPAATPASEDKTRV